MRQGTVIARGRPLVACAVAAVAVSSAGATLAQVSPGNPLPTIMRPVEPTIAPPVEPGTAPLPVAPAAGDDLPPEPAAPGAFEVNEDEITRALERALVLEGAQLLSPGVLQVQPSLAYARTKDQVSFIADADGQPVVVERSIERDIVSPSVALRIGLPFDAQAEMKLPYRFDQVSTTDRAGVTFLNETSDNTDGIGDIRLGLTKALLREGEMLPSLLANLYWDADTSRADSFNEVGVSLTAVRTQDPLVFIGRVSYERAFESGGTRPGDRFGLSTGMALAVTPESSWRVMLEQDFQRETRLSGSRVGGSDRDISVFSFGVSTVIRPKAVLDVTVGIGLSDDAPDYSVSLSLPVQFTDIF